MSQTIMEGWDNGVVVDCSFSMSKSTGFELKPYKLK